MSPPNLKRLYMLPKTCSCFVFFFLQRCQSPLQPVYQAVCWYNSHILFLRTTGKIGSHLITSASHVDPERISFCPWFKYLLTGVLLCNIYKCPYLRVPGSTALGLRSIFSLYLRLAALEGWKGGNGVKFQKGTLAILWAVWADKWDSYSILEWKMWLGPWGRFKAQGKTKDSTDVDEIAQNESNCALIL